VTPPRPSAADTLYAELMRARGDALSALVPPSDTDPTLLVSVLRRPVPPAFLELLAGTPPWSREPRVLAAIVLNPSLGKSFESPEKYEKTSQGRASPRRA
jgi:hypothetical protein